MNHARRPCRALAGRAVLHARCRRAADRVLRRAAAPGEQRTTTRRSHRSRVARRRAARLAGMRRGVSVARDGRCRLHDARPPLPLLSRRAGVHRGISTEAGAMARDQRAADPARRLEGRRRPAVCGVRVRRAGAGAKTSGASAGAGLRLRRRRCKGMCLSIAASVVTTDCGEGSPETATT